MISFETLVLSEHNILVVVNPENLVSLWSIPIESETLKVILKEENKMGGREVQLYVRL